MSIFNRRLNIENGRNREWSPPSMGIRNSRGVTSSLPASWLGIIYLTHEQVEVMEGENKERSTSAAPAQKETTEVQNRKMFMGRIIRCLIKIFSLNPRNSRGVTSALLASWVRIEYLMKGGMGRWIESEVTERKWTTGTLTRWTK
ncbi:hypothetical protein EVAR_94906_1 [Eumeta japonica]|uniref:Uncharacterized protein n=1 Tax=Eumeta variegata TaxID=151549 RepID=A0A4C1V9Q6_EUMVA|nr:hypothetical protein EVAR_94906_1 [Eumeta japonica]